jgi:hypothetical protein
MKTRHECRDRRLAGRRTELSNAYVVVGEHDLASTAEDMRDEGGRVRADTGAVVEGYRAVPLHGAQVDAI